MAFQHTSVLLKETVDSLAVKPDGIYVDATLGGGGHAFEVCRRLSDKGRFIGIDQDAAAIEAASVRLEGFGKMVTVIRSNYCDIGPQLRAVGIKKVDGIVLDLGVSSYQLDKAERGFSYRLDAPLDMRMDQSQPLTARTVVNEWPQEELRRILYEYGILSVCGIKSHRCNKPDITGVRGPLPSYHIIIANIKYHVCTKNQDNT